MKVYHQSLSRPRQFHGPFRVLKAHHEPCVSATPSWIWVWPHRHIPEKWTGRRTTLQEQTLIIAKVYMRRTLVWRHWLGSVAPQNSWWIWNDSFTPRLQVCKCINKETKTLLISCKWLILDRGMQVQQETDILPSSLDLFLTQTAIRSLLNHLGHRFPDHPLRDNTCSLSTISIRGHGWLKSVRPLSLKSTSSLRYQKAANNGLATWLINNLTWTN